MNILVTMCHNSQLKLTYLNLETVIYKYFVKLNVQMEEYYKFLYYQVEKSRCASDFTLDNVRICLFCNVSHLMNKIYILLGLECLKIGRESQHISKHLLLINGIGGLYDSKK